MICEEQSFRDGDLYRKSSDSLEKSLDFTLKGFELIPGGGDHTQPAHNTAAAEKGS